MSNDENTIPSKPDGRGSRDDDLAEAMATNHQVEGFTRQDTDLPEELSPIEKTLRKHPAANIKRRTRGSYTDASKLQESFKGETTPTEASLIATLGKLVEQINVQTEEAAADLLQTFNEFVANAQMDITKTHAEFRESIEEDIRRIDDEHATMQEMRESIEVLNFDMAFLREKLEKATYRHPEDPPHRPDTSTTTEKVIRVLETVVGLSLTLGVTAAAFSYAIHTLKEKPSPNEAA